jgi:DNA-binding beta-propeller fold protein YncE
LVCPRLIAQQQTSSEADSLARRTHRGFFVLNSPSSHSVGSDSILTFDSSGHSSVFFSASHNLQGLQDIACSLNGPPRVFVAHSDFSENISELLELNASGRIVRRIPFGTPGDGISALAFDDAGNFYAALTTTVFKNGVSFAHLPGGSEMGKMVADRRGRLYITQPITSQVLRLDALGNVTVFADATQGVNSPEGVAVDREGNIYVANNPPSAPAFILKFDPSGTPSAFAADISSQPEIWGMAFDLEQGDRINEGDRDLYAALELQNEILKFDAAGHSSVFADASDGLDFPISFARCSR